MVIHFMSSQASLVSVNTTVLNSAVVQLPNINDLSVSILNHPVVPHDKNHLPSVSN
jgi:hypothetical protein